MKAIYLKEIRGFFSSLSGYLVLCIFLLVSGLFVFGFEGAAGYLATDNFVASLGMKYHYESMARGVIDTRDVVYFLSVAVFFFALSEISLKTSLDRNS